jgi:hypothetical protein
MIVCACSVKTRGHLIGCYMEPMACLMTGPEGCGYASKADLAASPSSDEVRNTLW